ncbi:hypothetical protein SZ47_12485 [Brachyspira hyodysenteriae]|uniref:Uncharacterized protein n=1 Tax=Brachyspira hyodysenteriae ATCC 27164 TaxID=1266923 RepID=A0A3B6VTW5_BRAHO|nr:hypothetical protein [Brachyspira hyodysenteriae]ANN64599.1 hypothetical protein BHYOB78_12220 [Brachyspira hyodysenteriae ATCC 27164]KLI22791.1 hypothetical protein SZ47_12485 [Brachyspira hyodysenteriae]MCZ9924242.1 hypothetical protein [Brachyspira hyodysenteriae]
MIVQEKGVKSFFKNIIKKIFNKKDLSNFNEEQISDNNIRRKLYEYIYKVSFGNNKLIGLRYEILYAEYARIKKINLKKLAKNRKIKTIEMAIELDKNNNTNHLDNLYKLAKKLFTEAEENAD